MENLATGFRFLQFYAHAAHNLLGGETFFQDHSFLGDLYTTYETAFDDLVERMIGTEDFKDVFKLNKEAVNLLGHYEMPSNYADCFEILLEGEKMTCEEIEKLVKGKSQGTIQLLGDFANASEVRQYKIKQRLK